MTTFDIIAKAIRNNFDNIHSVTLVHADSVVTIAYDDGCLTDFPVAMISALIQHDKENNTDFLFHMLRPWLEV